MSHLNEEDVDQPVGRLVQEVELLEGKTEAEVPVGDVAEAKVPIDTFFLEYDNLKLVCAHTSLSVQQES